MTVIVDTYNRIFSELGPTVRLVAVSKTKPAGDIQALYDLGQRDFGENYVQELTEKQQQLPADIHWHFIGHLQTNKVRQIISFVHLIQSVDSLRLLKEIDRQAGAKGRVVDVLLQVHIAREDTKFGLDPAELADLMRASRAGGAAPGGTAPFPHVRVRGLMGMASFTEDPAAVRAEFRELKGLFDQYFRDSEGSILSMGMSADYKTAIEEGSNMVRIGSMLFGKRD